MDLITQLPRNRRGNDCIVTFVDKLSKMVHCVATAVDATTLAKLLGAALVLPMCMISASMLKPPAASLGVDAVKK